MASCCFFFFFLFLSPLEAYIQVSYIWMSYCPYLTLNLLLLFLLLLFLLYLLLYHFPLFTPFLLSFIISSFFLPGLSSPASPCPPDPQPQEQQGAWPRSPSVTSVLTNQSNIHSLRSSASSSPSTLLPLSLLSVVWVFLMKCALFLIIFLLFLSFSLSLSLSLFFNYICFNPELNALRIKLPTYPGTFPSNLHQASINLTNPLPLSPPSLPSSLLPPIPLWPIHSLPLPIHHSQYQRSDLLFSIASLWTICLFLFIFSPRLRRGESARWDAIGRRRDAEVRYFEGDDCVLRLRW